MEIPPAFLVAENGDVDRATERYGRTLEWRRRMRVDSILAMPQTHYDTIKAYVDAITSLGSSPQLTFLSLL
jgi:hypothetical protein